jgi:hypothetical protein
VYVAPPVATTAALSVDPATAAADSPVALTVDVSTSITEAPVGPTTGTVKFYDNGGSDVDAVTAQSTLLGSASPGPGGTATLTYGFFGVGLHDILGVFDPVDPSAYRPSTSLIVPFTATPPVYPPDAQTLEVTIPAGSITITTPYDSSDPFHLGTATLDANARAFHASAVFGDPADPAAGVTITDTRAGDLPWTASAEATDFTDGRSPPDRINSQNLALIDVEPDYIGGNALQSPDVTTTDVTSTPPGGTAYPPTATGTDGLGGVPHQFAAAVAGAGSVYLGGTLVLSAPTSTPAGIYTTTLTFTAA